MPRGVYQRSPMHLEQKRKLAESLWIYQHKIKNIWSREKDVTELCGKKHSR